MTEKLRWALEYERIRHKYMKSSIVLEITAAVLMIGLGLVAWALLLSLPLTAVYLRDKNHADYIVPKSDKDIKQEAVAQGIVIALRYSLYFIIAVAVMYMGYKADLSYFKSFRSPELLEKYPVSMTGFIIFGIVYTFMTCIENGLARLCKRKKTDAGDIFISVLFIFGFAIYFSNGLYIQGIKWAGLGISFGGTATNVMLVTGILCTLVRLIYQIVKFEPGDFKGSTEEIFRMANMKKRSKA